MSTTDTTQDEAISRGRQVFEEARAQISTVMVLQSLEEVRHINRLLAGLLDKMVSGEWKFEGMSGKWKLEGRELDEFSAEIDTMAEMVGQVQDLLS